MPEVSIAQTMVTEFVERLDEETELHLQKQDRYLNKLESDINGPGREQSYFSEVASWFGKQKWWQKALIAASIIGFIVLFCSIFSIVGLISIGVSIAAGIITTVLCTGMSIILTNHYNTELKYCTKANDKTEKLKDDLREIIKLSNARENEVTQLLKDVAKFIPILDDYIEELKQKNNKLAEHTQSLEKQVEQLEEGKTQLITTVQQLTQVAEKIEDSAQSLVQAENGVIEALNDSATTIKQNTIKSANAGNQIDEITSRLARTQYILDNINANLDASGQQIEAICQEKGNANNDIYAENKDESLINQFNAVMTSATNFLADNEVTASTANGISFFKQSLPRLTPVPNIIDMLKHLQLPRSSR